MMVDFPELVEHLDIETSHVVELITGLTPGEWELPTPAAGWAVRDQVSHLAYFDECTVLAITNPTEFRELADDLVAGGMDFPDRIAADLRQYDIATLFDRFLTSRRSLMSTLRGSSPKTRLPWFGPDMSVASTTTARLMETWAHGQDIYDTVGKEHPRSPGLRSIAHLGVATFAFVHTLNGLPVPERGVRVEITDQPTGEVWTWGPADAPDVVTGSSLDFVYAVTQRRNLADTDLDVTGPVARQWMSIAQAYAGAPGTGRPACRHEGVRSAR